MKILWICGLPRQVQAEALNGVNFGAHAAWSWILGHLPPSSKVELHIACPTTKGPWAGRSFEYQGATFHLVRCLPGRLQSGFLLDPLMFRPLVKKIKPDVVHGWGTEDSYSIIAQQLAPKRCVVQVQGLINGYRDFLPDSWGIKYVALRERCSLKKAKTVFVESGFSAELSRPYCGSKTRIVQVDHPLRSDFLTAVPGDGTSKSILFVGSICDRKGYADAIKAFSALGETDWTLRLVGGGSQADTDELKRLISKAPKPESIVHIPHATPEKITELMQVSSIFLLPSKMDTGPTALKEALAMGLWPVCYDNSGPKEYVSRFQYGSLAKTGDVDALSAVLNQAVQERPWVEGNLRATVIQQVRHELCAATIWEQLIRHYRRIIEESSTTATLEG
jgi:glycosyltransferase involved in cell wall biosynthesis